MAIVLWASAVVLAWPWVLYPALAFLAARTRSRTVRRFPIRRPVTVIVVARDEGHHLAAKLATLGSPAESGDLDVLVVDDGSKDDTAAVASSMGARVVRLATPQGKAAALNVGAEAARFDLLVLTDARQPLCDGAIAALLAPFADPRVGAVSGELEVRGGDRFFRRFENHLRRLEAATASTVGVTGALWAVRRSLLAPLPVGLILDDVLAPLAVAKAGRRVVVAPEARAIELPDACRPASERARRLRTLAGNLQLCARAPWVLVPGVNPLWWRFVSHKLARLLGPFAIGGLIVALATRPPKGPALAMSIAFAALLAGVVFSGRSVLAVAMRSFLSAQWLCLCAWFAFLTGRADRIWRTELPIPPASLPAPASTEVPAGSFLKRDVTDAG